MKYRRFGRLGVKVSEVSLGTVTFGRWISEEQSRSVLDAALDIGVNLVDTGDRYGKGMDTGNPNEFGESEEILGRLLKGRRNRVILATKFDGPVGDGINDRGQSRYHMMNSVENSLRRLQADHIDLYQVHHFDRETFFEETLRAFDDLIRQGKVRYIGVSNYAAWQLAKAHGTSMLHNLHRFESAQQLYNILQRDIEKEMLPFCESEKVGVMVYSPLARGLLTGKYHRGSGVPEGTRASAGDRRIQKLLASERTFDILDRLIPLAENRGWSLQHLAVSWLLTHSVVSTILLGATRPEQIVDNTKHMDERLTEEEMKEIDRICELN